MGDQNQKREERQIKSGAKPAIIIASIVVAVAMVGAAVIFTSKDDSQSSATGTSQTSRNVTAQELAESDGKDGRPCLVAVSGTVYEIEGFSLWQGGEHQTSGGMAYCGADMTDAMAHAPHGTSKLEQLEKIGPLVAE